jgi:hypothetical protein
MNCLSRLDVSLTKDGDILWSASRKNRSGSWGRQADEPHFLHGFRPWTAPLPPGLEAGPLSQWLHRGLTDAGLDAVLMGDR